MNLTVSAPGLQEMTTEEMKDTNGGLLFLIPVIVGAILLAGCTPSEPSCDKCQEPVT